MKKKKMPHVRRKSGTTTNRGTEGMVTSIVVGELLLREKVHGGGR
jgi:hypothetical protein